MSGSQDLEWALRRDAIHKVPNTELWRTINRPMWYQYEERPSVKGLRNLKARLRRRRKLNALVQITAGGAGLLAVAYPPAGYLSGAAALATLALTDIIARNEQAIAITRLRLRNKPQQKVWRIRQPQNFVDCLREFARPARTRILFPNNAGPLTVKYWAFAERLGDLLRAAGWGSEFLQAWVVTDHPFGIRIRTSRMAGKVPIPFDDLAYAFARQGISVIQEEAEFLDPGVIDIVVGRVPEYSSL